jgi:hypothetical protein
MRISGRPLVEYVAVGAALLCVLFSVAPAFFKNLRASRMVEPMERLRFIAERATAMAAGRPVEVAYPSSAPLTPGLVPRGELASDPPGTWDHPTWRLLDVAYSSPHSYSFAFESRNAPGKATYRAVAHGDLDGDGLVSTFEISGESRDGAEPVTSPMESRREVE